MHEFMTAVGMLLDAVPTEHPLVRRVLLLIIGTVIIVAIVAIFFIGALLLV